MTKRNKKYLLDTNICIDYLNASRKTEDKRKLREKYVFEAFEEMQDTADFYVSQATVVELKFGAKKSQNEAKNLLRIEKFIEVIPEIKIDDMIWEAFIEMKTELSRKGKMIADMDLLIAATARSYDLVLISNDKDMNNLDFLEKNLIERENWLKDYA